ncbi:MAG TPA: phosphate ABC transporter substrate-binding protein PstS [Methylomirabilota bacterium]|nr:phosphate ABC transporter substrate-binding protein PstS [Methylomirabilota bacterium]
MNRRAPWLLVSTALVVCLGGPAPAAAQTSPGSKVMLQGAGATFPAPLYKKWIGIFTAQNPDITVEYKDVGSGEGVQRFLAHTVDFGASDAAMTDEQMAKVANGARLVPTTAGMVVLAYNLPGLDGALKLSRDVYADIFLRKIGKWNDPRIQALNPGLKLPNRSIVLAARQDRSGTTFALANHLSAISAEWQRGPGVGYSIDWSGRAMLARGNEGVAGLVKLSEGALGYMEYGFAERLRLPTAQLQNKAGRYVGPSDRSGQAALTSSVARMPDNLRLYLPDPEGEDSYPIVSLTWLLLYERYPDQQKSAALKRFLTWGLSLGQSYGPELGYIALPADVTSRSRAALERIQ